MKPTETWLVKLGGSLVTDKAQENSADRPTLRRLIQELTSAAEELGALGANIILVHGAGSYGHPLVDRIGLDTPGNAGLVQASVRELHHEVQRACLELNMPAVSCPVSTLARFRYGRIVEFQTDSLHSALRRHAVPLLGGEIAVDEDNGYVVCSGDDIMWALGRAFRPDRVVFATDVDGVYDRDPKIHDDAEMFTELDLDSARKLLPRLDASPGPAEAGSQTESGKVSRTETKARLTDVTGQMAGKLRAIIGIAEMSCSSTVVNGRVRHRLHDALRGRAEVSTIVEGAPLPPALQE